MTPTQAKDWLFGGQDDIFRTGWQIIADMYGWPEKKARILVGKLDKAGGPQLAQRAVLGIQKNKPQEPYSWALKGIRAIQAKEARKHRPGYRPPPVAPAVEISTEERHRGAARLAKFRAELEGM